MGTLHKYIFKQVFGASFLTVALFVFVLVVGNVVKEVMGEFAAGRIDLSLFIYIIVLIIPGVIPYAMPLGMLTGILLVFGRMSAQSEIVAIKASGRSIFDIAAPVFFLAILTSIFSVAINFYYAPAADSAYKSTLKNLIRNNPLQFIKPGVPVRDFPGYIIYANSAEGKTLKDFRIWEINKNGDVNVSTRSETAEISYNEGTEEIELTMRGVSVDYRRPENPDDLSRPAYIAKMSDAKVSLSLSQILGSYASGKYKLTLLTFGELMKARFNWKLSPDDTPEIRYKRRIEVQTQIQKNFAMAFSIFSMVVLAIPLGIKASRTETFANAGIALALAMGYYLMTVVITWLENYPHLRPDILIWLPNLLFIILGIILFIKASKN